MNLLTIGFKENFEKIIEIINKQLYFFEREKIHIDEKIEKIGDINFATYFIKDKKGVKYKNIKNIFNYYIAEAITDIVIDVYQEKIIDRLIIEKCYYLDSEDKKVIKSRVVDYLNRNEYVLREGIMPQISKKAKILKTVMDFLEENDNLIIDGLINFRLKFFTELIEEALEKNIEDFFVEKEYREFIRVLQYFVELQESKVDLVNIIFKNDGTYQLLDKKMNLIDNDIFQELAEEISENEMNYDDLLISSLITIAPKKIIIHIEKSIQDREIIKVIKSVFQNKVSVCPGCRLCLKEKDNKIKIEKEK
ncbi:putative sporulation protein YtxC [Caloranaerobacter sp. TR13]|uniref:putative sporulation protein YtxC n=1 Tax=Caloranaerobacter sp. TR13 TaxID=1302151 RepID=UPI0006D3F878|nr:putative sporulation protein YtxC [Caloranaerobacter sp. TR13]